MSRDASARPERSPRPPSHLLVLRLGAEGGSVEIRTPSDAVGSVFIVEQVDQLGWMMEPEEPERVSVSRFGSLDAALVGLDRMRWWVLYPLVVAPAFAAQIDAAVRARTARVPSDYRRWVERAREAADR